MSVGGKWLKALTPNFGIYRMMCFTIYNQLRMDLHHGFLSAEVAFKEGGGGIEEVASPLSSAL